MLRRVSLHVPPLTLPVALDALAPIAPAGSSHLAQNHLATSLETLRTCRVSMLENLQAGRQLSVSCATGLPLKRFRQPTTVSRSLPFPCRFEFSLKRRARRGGFSARPAVLSLSVLYINP